MKRLFTSVFGLTILVVFLFCVSVSSQSPVARKGVQDTTKAWGKLFNIKGKLEVSNGERDDRAAAADGPIRYKFDAKLKKPGCYNFTFVMIDKFGQAYQVHTVRVLVSKDYRNSQKPAISPEGVFNQAIVVVQPNETVGVQWWYNPGGEGVPGGWILKKVSFTQAMSGVPGCEGRFTPQ